VGDFYTKSMRPNLLYGCSALLAAVVTLVYGVETAAPLELVSLSTAGFVAASLTLAGVALLRWLHRRAGTARVFTPATAFGALAWLALLTSAVQLTLVWNEAALTDRIGYSIVMAAALVTVATVLVGQRLGRGLRERARARARRRADLESLRPKS
jgi:hypothetical protein